MSSRRKFIKDAFIGAAATTAFVGGGGAIAAATYIPSLALKVARDFRTYPVQGIFERSGINTVYERLSDMLHSSTPNSRRQDYGRMSSTPEIPDLSFFCEDKKLNVFDKDGGLAYSREYKAVPKITSDIKWAVRALEDKDFYNRSSGIDRSSAARAVIENKRAGRVVEGASTVTMQLADMLGQYGLAVKDKRTSWGRKVAETGLSELIEKKYTGQKDLILKAYLNLAYFGNGFTGYENASIGYFGKSSSQLSHLEAGLVLCGTNNPSKYNLFTESGIKKALKRVGNRYIKSSSYIAGEAAAKKEFERQSKLIIGQLRRRRLENETEKRSDPNSAFVDYVLRNFNYADGDENKLIDHHYLAQFNMDIHTTLDQNVQRELQHSLEQRISQVNSGLSGSGVVIDDNGNIRAMASVHKGNRVKVRSYNPVAQSIRSCGSLGKLFEYAYALMQGRKEKDTLIGKYNQFKFGSTVWNVRNYNKKSIGQMSLRNGFINSNNQASAWLLYDLYTELRGQKRNALNELATFTQSHGFSETIPPYPSIILGSKEVSTRELAQAFSVYMNRGVLKPAESLTAASMDRYGKDMSKTGRDTFRLSRQHTTRVVNQDISDRMNTMLRRVTTHGTGRSAQVNGVDLAVKTGTSQGWADANMAGFSPEYSFAVWMGHDDHTSLNQASSSVVGPLVKNFFKQIKPTLTRKRFI